MKQLPLIPLGLLLLAAATGACNKDGVIDAPEPDPGTDSPVRPPSASGSARSTRVFEWMPAPGQFINEPSAGAITTMEQACDRAQQRLDAGQYVSLGAFGGYIVVGFDHSITADASGYDFAIGGNAFFNAGTGEGGSNEPGIVYVMQDSNGNGLPDDTWYELRGSETGTPACLRDYAVTYYRPKTAGSNIRWTDSEGREGTVDYLKAFHPQDSYYPAWIDLESYTLRGTRLEARTTQDPNTGLWDNSAFGFGYADNMGDDVLPGDPMRNGFRISDAMLPDGSPAGLKHIDFVKVQTGVNSKAGWLGEVSTEVFFFEDLHLKK